MFQCVPDNCTPFDHHVSIDVSLMCFSVFPTTVHPLIIMFQLMCPLCVSVCSRQLYMKAIQREKYLQVLLLWKTMIRNQGKIIRINHECEARIDKSVPRIAVWHHEACRVMTNGDHEGQIFYPTLTQIIHLLTTVFIHLFILE